MRSVILAAVTSGFFVTTAFAQGAAPAASGQSADDQYVAACSAKSNPELCQCLVATAGETIPNEDERKIFYAYTTGDVEFARGQRALFEPERNVQFNTVLQKAERAVHERCDKFRPQTPMAPASAPK